MRWWVLAASIRLTVVISILLFDFVIRDYDESSNSVFTKWDAVYFIEIVESGYHFDMMTVFQKGFPQLVRIVSNTTRLPTEVVAVVGSNISFLAAVFVFKLLSESLIPDSKITKYSVVALCLSPAGVFLSVPYSESLSVLLSFLTMLFWVREQYWGSVVTAVIASLVRLNSILLLGFPLWSALAKRNVSLLVVTAAGVLPAFGNQFLLWREFCPSWGGLSEEFVENNKIICNQDVTSFFEFYGRLQSEYWNIGLFRYYQVKQIPNFLLASPFLFVSFFALSQKISAKQLRSAIQFDFRTPPIFIIYCYHAVLVLLAVTMTHIQISPRLLAGSPAVYWSLAELLQTRGKRVVLTYLIAWQFVGAVMYSNFYPWT